MSANVRVLPLRLLLAGAFLFVWDQAACAAFQVDVVGGIEFFEKRVRPLLVEHCYECHSRNARKLQAGLLLDSRDGLLRGGDSGPAIVPREAERSLLIEAVRYRSFEMPPRGKLSKQQIDTLLHWINLGAPWPDEPASAPASQRDDFELQRRKAEHWVWRPIHNPPLPDVADLDWPRSELDYFILAGLEQVERHPAGDVDRNALVRRLFFDLIGLPPSPEQLRAASLHEHGDPIPQLVDELLDSPHFGERWGRHWLDLVRYAESRGHEFDNDAPNAFQYRDYVIRALNQDVPYDQLIREHIAGDLLESPRLHPTAGFNESLLGTGFWFLGEWVHSPVDIRKDETDRFDNMIDVMSKAFLGVTVACARCHDHKFDAISTEDYYALFGFLQSSDYRQVRFESVRHNREIARRLAAIDEEFRESIAGQASQLAPASLADQLRQLRQQHTIPRMQTCVVVDYGSDPQQDYLQDGFLFGTRPRRAGDPYLANVSGRPMLQFAARSAAVSDTFWDGLTSVGEKGVQSRSRLATIPRSGRTLRTPTFTLQHGTVTCRVHGNGHVVACVDSHRLIAGPLHRETVQAIKAENPWVRLDLDRYIGHRLHLEFTPDDDAQLEVSLVLQGAADDVRGLFEQRELAIAAAVARFAQAVRRRQVVGPAETDGVDRLVREWSERRGRLRSLVQRESHLAMAMIDGSGEDERVLIRGNASQPGRFVLRRFLSAVDGDQPLVIARGSGRLQLAQRINDPSNPLTLRVIVNRIWHHLLGRGIVPTTDDFGVLGQPPTHPELLDHLATRFLAQGRSIKRLIRYIVLSRTYRMSGHADPQAVRSDPRNLRWHHRPPQRLQGEVIRDALLAVSGRLDRSMFGEPIPIHLTPFMEGRGRPEVSGPLDGDGRRSIYIAVRRNFISPFMLAFDTPVPFSTMGRRNVSNVPAQALILMNDPLVVQQAQLWAERALRIVPGEGDAATARTRIDWMYQAAFARPATELESQSALDFLSQQSARHSGGLDDPILWADLAHALINTKEFIFLR